MGPMDRLTHGSSFVSQFMPAIVAGTRSELSDVPTGAERAAECQPASDDRPSHRGAGESASCQQSLLPIQRYVEIFC